jgi:hypothetical protein
MVLVGYKIVSELPEPLATVDVIDALSSKKKQKYTDTLFYGQALKILVNLPTLFMVA